MVVLGSGGHTMEMLELIADWDMQTYPIDFVVANTDTTSLPKAISVQSGFYMLRIFIEMMDFYQH